MRIVVSRAPGAERVVSPLELFFDLVYVFAIATAPLTLIAGIAASTAVLVAVAFRTRSAGTNRRQVQLAPSSCIRRCRCTSSSACSSSAGDGGSAGAGAAAGSGFSGGAAASGSFG